MLRIGLLCRDSGTQTHRVSLRFVKVVDFQVQMHLFRHGRIRPRGWDVVLHLDRDQPVSVDLDSVELVVAMCDFAAEEGRPEVSEGRRVRAVQRRQTQSRRRHSSEPKRHPFEIRRRESLERALWSEITLDKGHGDLSHLLPTTVNDEGVSTVLDLFDLSHGFISALALE